VTEAEQREMSVKQQELQKKRESRHTTNDSLAVGRRSVQSLNRRVSIRNMLSSQQSTESPRTAMMSNFDSGWLFFAGELNVFLISAIIHWYNRFISSNFDYYSAINKSHSSLKYASLISLVELVYCSTVMH